jgi:amino acid transporter
VTGNAEAMATAESRPGLASRSVGARRLWFYALSASAPLTVLVAGIGTTFKVTGVVGVPVSYLFLMVALSLLTVGYVVAGGYLEHTAPFLAVAAHGLGRAFGLACGLLAVAAYLALQLALFAFLGATLAAWVGAPGSWPFWSVLTCVGLGLLGMLRVDLVAKVLAVGLVAELVMVAAIILAGFGHPAGGHVSLAGMSPTRLFTGDWGGVFALGIAGFIGYETPGGFREEAFDSRVVRRATFGALWTLGPLYVLAPLAMTVAVGPADLKQAFTDDPVLPLTILADRLGPFGPLVAGTGQVLLLTSVAGAVLSLEGSVNRYVFAMARERLLPRLLQRTGGSGLAVRDAPIVASATQTLLLVAGVLVFAGLGADPLAVMFTWSAAGAAFAVVTLLILASVAAMRFLAARKASESVWTRLLLPGPGVLAGVGLLWAMTARMYALLGALHPSRLTTWLIPGLVAAVLCGGLVWAGLLYAFRRKVYDQIGEGGSHRYAYPERRFAGQGL